MRTDRQRGSEAYASIEGLDASRRNEPEVAVADDRRRLYWRHLATVAVVTAVAQGIVLCTCFLCLATAMQSECRAAAKHEAERILREKHAQACETSSNFVDAEARISRVRRRQPPNDRNSRSGTATTSRPSPRHNQRRAQRTQHQASTNDISEVGIHLEFSVPTLEPGVYARLRADNRSKETVDYGYVFSHGRFKPYAERFNGTVRYPFRNWAPAKWFNSTSNGALFQYDSQRGSVRVLRSGIYYVYSQIRMYHTQTFSYAAMVNDDSVLFKCIEGTNSASPIWQFNSCHLGGITALKAGDRLWLRDMYGDESHLRDYYVHLDPYLGASSYWGVVRLGH